MTAVVMAKRRTAMQMIGRMILVILCHNAVSLPRWSSGMAQSVVCSDKMFPVAKKEQRSFGARCPSAALSDVRLWGHASGFDV